MDPDVDRNIEKITPGWQVFGIVLLLLAITTPPFLIGTVSLTLDGWSRLVLAGPAEPQQLARNGATQSDCLEGYDDLMRARLAAIADQSGRDGLIAHLCGDRVLAQAQPSSPSTGTARLPLRRTILDSVAVDLETSTDAHALDQLVVAMDSCGTGQHPRGTMVLPDAVNDRIRADVASLVADMAPARIAGPLAQPVRHDFPGLQVTFCPGHAALASVTVTPIEDMPTGGQPMTEPATPALVQDAPPPDLLPGATHTAGVNTATPLTQVPHPVGRPRLLASGAADAAKVRGPLAQPLIDAPRRAELTGAEAPTTRLPHDASPLAGTSTPAPARPGSLAAVNAPGAVDRAPSIPALSDRIDVEQPALAVADAPQPTSLEEAQQISAAPDAAVPRRDAIKQPEHARFPDAADDHSRRSVLARLDIRSGPLQGLGTLSGDDYILADILSLTGAQPNRNAQRRAATEQSNADGRTDGVLNGPTLTGADAADDIKTTRRTRFEVQRRLSLIGHGVGGVDGIFGPRTRAAIAAFQADQKLPQTGALDPGTLASLKRNSATAYARWTKRVAKAREKRRAARLAAKRKAEQAARQVRVSEVPVGRRSPQCARDQSGVILSHQSFSCDVDILSESLSALFDG